MQTSCCVYSRSPASPPVLLAQLYQGVFEFAPTEQLCIRTVIKSAINYKSLEHFSTAERTRSAVFKAKSLKRFLIITAKVVLPLEVIVMLAYMFGVANLTEFYDTGSFVMLILGSILGYFIQKGISDMYNGGRAENDNG